MTLGWYVHCGCTGHGDHGGCAAGCAQYGCAHPVGLVMSVADEDDVEALRGQTPTRDMVMEAAAEKVERIRHDAIEKINQVEQAVEAYL